MKVLIDNVSLERIDQSIVSGQTRYYYVADSEALIIVVSRGDPLELLQGKVLEAAIGWSIGWHGKCRREHEGLKLLKVTLFDVVDGSKYNTTLSALVAESRKIKRERPPRRAPWARPYGFDKEEK